MWPSELAPVSSPSLSPCPYTPTPIVSAATEDNLLSVAQQLRQDVEHVVINTHQAKLMVNRLWRMCYGLAQLPDPRPTPAQLSLVASVAELLAQLSAEGTYAPLLLRQGFACTAKFEAVSSRLKAVWRLQSTGDWAAEDRAAAEKDETEDAAELLRRLRPLSEAKGQALATTLSQFWFSNQGQQLSSSFAFMQDISRREMEPFRTAEAPDETVTEADVPDWVRRRQLGTWRLPYDALHLAPVLSAAAGGHSNHDDDRHTLTRDELNRREPQFCVRSAPPSAHGRRRWFFGTCPVLIDALETGSLYTTQHGEDEEAELIEAAFVEAQSHSIMDFVQDAFARVGWSHPHLLTYWGAFTEKGGAAHGTATHSSNGDVDAVADDDDAFVEGDAETPQLCLAMVLADPHQLPVLAEEPLSGAHTITTSLHELLFVQRRVLTLGECVQLTGQIADALHYMLLGDIVDLPDEVLTAWCTLGPARIFVSEFWAPPDVETDEPKSETAAAARGSSEVFVSEEPIVHSAEETSRGESRELLPRECSIPLAQQTVLRARLARYAPPCAVTGPFTLHSRWQPHPQAASPSCYALSQLLLALLTRCPPYRRLRTQAALRQSVFDVPDDDPDLVAEGLPAVKTSRPRGYALPSVLPEPLKALCASGLRLVSAHAARDRAQQIVSSLPSLQTWREQLTQLAGQLSPEAWEAPLDLSHDPIYGSHPQSTASTRTGTAFSPSSDSTTEVVMREKFVGDGAEREYGEGWFEFGLPSYDDDDAEG